MAFDVTPLATLTTLATLANRKNEKAKYVVCVPKQIWSRVLESFMITPYILITYKILQKWKLCQVPNQLNPWGLLSQRTGAKTLSSSTYVTERTKGRTRKKKTSQNVRTRRKNEKLEARTCIIATVGSGLVRIGRCCVSDGKRTAKSFSKLLFLRHVVEVGDVRRVLGLFGHETHGQENELNCIRHRVEHFHIIIRKYDTLLDLCPYQYTDRDRFHEMPKIERFSSTSFRWNNSMIWF